MIEFFDDLTHWHWLGLAVAFLGARALVPFGMVYTLGRGILTLAFTAGIVGLALYAAPDLSGLQQLGLAVLASAPIAYGLNWWAARGTRRAEQYLDQIFTLTQARSRLSDFGREQQSLFGWIVGRCPIGETRRRTGKRSEASILGTSAESGSL